jgi:hypothetical protein
MIITIKLETEATKNTQRRRVSDAPRKEHINAERNVRLRRWLDEEADRAPWNALADARSGSNNMI